MKLSTLWQRLKNNWTRNNAQRNVPEEHADETVEWHIYENPTGTQEGLYRRHWIVNELLKKFLKTGLILLRFFIEPFLTRSVDLDREPHNQLLLNFDRAYEQALSDWRAAYCDSDSHGEDGYWREHYDAIKPGGSDAAVQDLRFIKRLILTFAYNDTAYREVLNTLGVEWTRFNHETYSNDEDGDVGMHHLFFPSYNNFNTAKLSVYYYKIYPGIGQLVQPSGEEIERKGLHIVPVYNSEKKDRAQAIVKHARECDQCCDELPTSVREVVT